MAGLPLSAPRLVPEVREPWLVPAVVLGQARRDLPMKSYNKRKAKGPCIWSGCKLPGCYFTGYKLGFEVYRGYARSYHDRVIARENLAHKERLKEGPRFVPAPVQWQRDSR